MRAAVALLIAVAALAAARAEDRPGNEKPAQQSGGKTDLSPAPKPPIVSPTAPGNAPTTSADGGVAVAGPSDASPGGRISAGPADAGVRDAGLPDGGLSDGGVNDGGIAMSPIATPVRPAVPPKPPPPLAAGLGRISGKVTVAGLAPKLASLPVTKDMKLCGINKPDESLEVGVGGGVRNAVLWVLNGPPPAKAARPRVKLDQAGCVFTPHVLVTSVGAELLVVNSDPVLHNVHATGEASVFNYAMPIKNYSIPTRLKKAGLTKIGCDVHPWMHAWIWSLPTTAAAVSEVDGSYWIDLPAGKYQLKLWHERLGEREDTIEVVAGDTVTHDVSLTPR